MPDIPEEISSERKDNYRSDISDDVWGFYLFLERKNYPRRDDTEEKMKKKQKRIIVREPDIGWKLSTLGPWYSGPEMIESKHDACYHGKIDNTLKRKDASPPNPHIPHHHKRSQDPSHHIKSHEP